MPLPVPQQHHLRREGRIAVDGVELRRQRDARFGAVGPHDRVAAVDADVGVDVHEPVALAGRLEREGREVRPGAQRRGELHASAAIGEIEVRRERQRVGLR
jgi:hypothetical protein